MKLQQFQKPLVQSALVLLAIFLLIGFVAGSETHTVLGGITAIFKGVLYTILLAIALIISLVFSIAVLVAIFLGAIAMYSPQTSSNMYQKLRQSLSGMWSTVSSYKPPKKASEDTIRQSSAEPKVPEAQVKHQNITPDVTQRVDETRKELSAEIEAVEKKVQDLHKQNTDISAAVNELENKVTEMPVDEVSAAAELLGTKQEELSANLTDCISKLESIDDAVKKNESTVKQQSSQLKAAEEKIAKLSTEIESLRKQLQQVEATEESNAESEEEPRIFAYLENEKDKKKFSDLVDQAVKKNMTYAEIDEFLTEKLAKKTDAIIKEHPALTKEFIRERKNS